MSEKKKPIVTRNFMKNLSRGAVKSVPLGGALLEQVIYGTLDGEAAKEEAEKLHSALSQIAEKLQGQDVNFGDIISELRKQAAFREEIRAELNRFHAVLKDPDNAAISDELADAVERMIVHNLPYRSIGGLFKGREDMLERLLSELGAGKTTAITQVQAIHGLGGVGKTRLAVEYAWRALEDGRHTAVFFVVADTAVTLNTNLAALAGPNLLNLPEQESREQPVIVEAVLSELGRRAGWLMIVDNVDSDDSAKTLREEILPRLSAGDMLMTSRRSNWPDDIADLPIDKLAETDAVAYLLEKTERKRAKSPKDKELAKQVACELDYLPVALEQAGGYIDKLRYGFGTYLEELTESREKVLSWHSEELVKYPVAVLSTWQTTEEHLGPQERAILRMACFLSPELIPTELFESQPEKIRDVANLLPKELEPSRKLAKRKGQFDVRDLLAGLAGWSMINLTEASFTIHRLVQDSIRLSIPEDKRKAWTELALNLVNDYIPAEPLPQDIRSWQVWRPMGSHVGVLVGHADSFGISRPTERLMNDLGCYLYARARLDEAEPLFERTIEIHEKLFGSEDPNVAITLGNLGVLLREMNRLDEAEPMSCRALAIDEKSFGPDHPCVARDLNNLARLLRETHRLPEAERKYRRALQIDEKFFGKDHPNVAFDLNDLAELLRDMNRVKEAEPMYRQAVEILEKSPLGDEHPNVATALHNLAQLLRETDRLEEAEPMYHRALKIDEKSFGPEHPKVARDLNSLAQLLKATNRLDEAEPLMRRALEIWEKSLGPDHPNTQTARENLEDLK